MAAYSTAGVQCTELSTGVFDAFDLRKCLRCGLNDKTATSCRYHPSRRPKRTNLRENEYSSEWHNCREHCGKDESRGCKKDEKHFYGSHLPFDPCRSRSGSGSKRSRSSRDPKSDPSEKYRAVGVMTEVSLMDKFRLSNKSERSQRSSKRSTSPTPRMDELMRRSNLSLSNMSQKTICPKHQIPSVRDKSQS